MEGAEPQPLPDRRSIGNDDHQLSPPSKGRSSSRYRIWTRESSHLLQESGRRPSTSQQGPLVPPITSSLRRPPPWPPKAGGNERLVCRALVPRPFTSSAERLRLHKEKDRIIQQRTSRGPLLPPPLPPAPLPPPDPNPADDIIEQGQPSSSFSQHDKMDLAIVGTPIDCPDFERRGGEEKRGPFTLPDLTSSGTQIADTTRRTNNIDTVKSKDDRPVAVSSIRGRRPYMEDEYVIMECVEVTHRSEHHIVGQTTSAFLMCDGHAGGRCSKALTSTLIPAIANDPEFSTDLGTAIVRGFHRANTDFLRKAEKQEMNDGSTASIVFLRDGWIVVGHVGDSRVVLCFNGKGIPLTVDHKPDHPEERRRILAFGGRVVNCGVARVNGNLAVARAFGNLGLRSVIRADPEVHKRILIDGDDFLIVASDGLWDVITNQEVAGILTQWVDRIGLQSCAELLTALATRKGSMDNITVVLVDLRKRNSINPDSSSRKVLMTPAASLSSRLSHSMSPPSSNAITNYKKASHQLSPFSPYPTASLPSSALPSSSGRLAIINNFGRTSRGHHHRIDRNNCARTTHGLMLPPSRSNMTLQRSHSAIGQTRQNQNKDAPSTISNSENSQLFMERSISRRDHRS